MKSLNSLILLLITGCGPYNIGTDDGANGKEGPAGKDGVSPVVEMIRFSSDDSVCETGSGVIIKVTQASGVSLSVICDGLNGNDGPIGPQGEPGQDGQDGEDGADAPSSPYQVMQVIDPCGDASGIFDEVILKMANGSLLASFSDKANGQNTRLSLLVPGNYVTTDGSDCHFSVNGSGLVSW